MNLYMRLLVCISHNIRKPEIDLKDAMVRSFRVLPHDLDIFGHMTNSRFLQIMDVGRVQWMMRSGVAKLLFKNRIAPVIASNIVLYKRSLKPWQRYKVHTRMVCWNDDWLFVESKFINERGQCVALGCSRVRLLQQGNNFSPVTAAEMHTPGIERPAFPAYIQHWQHTDQEMMTLVKNHDNQPDETELPLAA